MSTTVITAVGVSTVITEAPGGQTIISQADGPSTVISAAGQPGQAGRPGRGSDWTFRTVTANYTAAAADALNVDASSAPITITLPAPTANTQIAVTKTDGTANAVTVTGFDPLTAQDQSVTFVADGTRWRIIMAYTPGLGSVVANINALKQQAVSARVTQAGSATPISAAFGTQYEITGSTNQTINLPASSSLPASSTGVVVVKCGPSYSGTITVAPASGTIDGAANFTLTGGGQENLFEVGTSDTDWQVG